MNMWVKRSVALLSVAGAALALMGPTAQAGTALGTMTVSTTINAACTMAAPQNLVFPNYVNGTSNPVLSTSGIDITCPGSTVLSPTPVTFTFVPVTPATFNMSVGGGGALPLLPYYICDGACAAGSPPANAYTAGSAGPSISEHNGASAQTYTLGGQIPAGTSGLTTGAAYTQTLNVTLTY